MGVEEMIKGHDMFRSLSFDEIARISTFSASSVYKAGDIVFESGSLGTHFYVVLEGRVNLKLPSDDAESTLLVGRMEKGAIMGLSPLLGYEHYTTQAQCAESSTILRVEIAPFRELLNENTPVCTQITSQIARVYFSRYIDTLKRFQNILNDIAVH